MKIRFMRTDNDIFGEDEIIHPIIQISRNNDVYISILTELLFKFNTYTEKICFNVEKTLKLFQYRVEEDDKYPYGKPQTDEVARGSGNREYGCRRLREKLPNFSGVSFFRAGNSSNRVNAFHICVYVHRCAVPRYIALQHP